MNAWNRRQWLAASLSAPFATRLSARSLADAADDMPIVDTHQHLWDRSIFKLEWIADGSVLDRNFLPSDYAEATRGLGVVAAVYMEVDVTVSQQTDEARYVSALCREGKGATRASVISGRPDSPGFADYLDQFRGDPYVKGLRQVLHASATPPGHCLKPEFVKGIQELGKRGLSFDLCMRAAELGDGAKLVRQCPDTQFVLDHCGNPNVKAKPSKQWIDDIDRLAAQPNVVGKISGVIAGSDPSKPAAEQLAPFVNHVWNAFGPDRVVFGGDWPVCLLGGSYAKWVETLREIATDRSAEDRRKLFHDNAVRVYRLGKV
jgi:predicted TIM-barrel fold metal-dependent hydrolase